MASNYLNNLDKNLKECENYDLDWTLLPNRLKEACKLFGKGLKQRETSIFFGLIVLTTFCMGHACINVQNGFWKEPVIVWIASVIATGRCKSAYHEFLSDILDLVADKVEIRSVKSGQMILPHCTWDKFGELLAENGGRSLGLFDELMSFFATMNMYSSHKMQISDTREYQDFLQLFTGKSKTRETVTGNANFKMERTSFSFLGFTQPHAALPVIQDTSNCAKGFTSRILWYFPPPVFARFEDTILTEEENDTVQQFKDQLVDFLADLYIHGEKTFQIVDKGKVKTVTVNRTEYELTPNAITEFKNIHDEWELNVCKKNPHDALLGGIYSRGKSHVLRLSVPIQLILSEFDTVKETLDSTSLPDSETEQSEAESVAANNSTTEEERDESDDSENIEMGDDDTLDNENSSQTQSSTNITSQAITVAHSLVTTCLSQMCTLNDRTHVLNNLQEDTSDSPNAQIIPATPQGMNKVFVAVLSVPGPTVSFTVLNTKGVFRRHKVDNLSGKYLMQRTADEISNLDVGKIHTLTIPGNNSKVYFFRKQTVPQESEEAVIFARKLANIGMSLPQYIEAFEKDDDDRAKHTEDYATKRDASESSSSSSSPRKRQRMDNIHTNSPRD